MRFWYEQQGCERCKRSYIYSRDYKRGDNKKIFSRSAISKGVGMYEERIKELERELSEANEKLKVVIDALCAIENATDSHAVFRSDEVNRLAIETLKAIKEKEAK